MAGIRKKGGSYYCTFRFQGRRYYFTVGNVPEAQALAKGAEVDETLDLLERGRLSIPDGVSLEEFVAAGGKSPVVAVRPETVIARELVDRPDDRLLFGFTILSGNRRFRAVSDGDKVLFDRSGDQVAPVNRRAFAGDDFIPPGPRPRRGPAVAPGPPATGPVRPGPRQGAWRSSRALGRQRP